MTVSIARLSAVLLVAAPLTAALRAQHIEYAPGTMKYRVSSATSGSQTTPGGTASFDIGVEERITLTVMRHAKDTVMAMLTLDSISIKSPGPQPDLSKLVGAKFVSLVSPTGKFYTSKAPEGLDPQLAPIVDAVGKFLPSFRGNLAPGVTWSDTISGKVAQMGMDVERTNVSTYKVDGDTTIGGQKAFRVLRNAAVKGVGAGSMQGTPVTMEMSATSAGSFFITASGTYLGGSTKDDALTKIMVVQQNMEITIKQSGVTKTEPVR